MFTKVANAATKRKTPRQYRSQRLVVFKNGIKNHALYFNAMFVISSVASMRKEILETEGQIL